MPRPRTQPAAPSRVVPQLLRHLRRVGADAEALRRRLGFPQDAEALEEVALTTLDFERLLEGAAAAVDDPLLAIHLPGLLEERRYSLPEVAARASPTLEEAFRRVARYAPLFYAHLRFSLHRSGGELLVVSSTAHADDRASRFSNEFSLASALAHARRLTGAPLAARRVWFAHPSPGDPRQLAGLAGFFGTAALAFDRASSGLAFDGADARRVPLASDPRLQATADHLAEQALAGRPAADDAVALVQAQVRRALPRGRPEARAVARQLRLSTRTLQRRLEAQGTTFSALVERTRQDLARELVGDPAVPLGEVSYRLGFSEPAAFSRAFKRWTGRPPGQFRAAGGQGGPSGVAPPRRPG